jgi:hypothetical protein
MKAETTAAKDVHEDSSIIEGPSTASSGSDADSRAKTVTPENGESSPLSKNESATVQASTSSVTSKSSEPSKREVKKPEANKSQGSLVGKINNLVTVDLGIIGS